MPGSFLDRMVFDGASPEAIANFKEKWGLNDPLHVQYYRYMVNVFNGDFGTSIQFREPVWDVVGDKIFNSFVLVAPAVTLAYVLGSLLGLKMGTSRGSVLEKYGNLVLLSFGTIPGFYLGILIIIIFSGWLGWFPTSGMTSAETATQFAGAAWWRKYFTVDFLKHYILPFSTILLLQLYYPSLIMRTSVVETKDQDFIQYHRLKGLSDGKLLQYVGKHSILPVITMYPISLSRALSGLVLVEVVFNWPGIGFALFRGVLARDFPVVQFVFFIVAVFIIFGNFIVDIAYGIIDPRVSVDSD
jgi:peptide/nickel transport system permease protein